ncbi:MAG: hypothetical protein M3Y36_09935 [Actinomycetota bacterium]|nr:hypothetical protein [Actinomycetota bacterium]
MGEEQAGRRQGNNECAEVQPAPPSRALVDAAQADDTADGASSYLVDSGMEYHVR